MVDRISSSEELVVWAVGFLMCVWIAFDTTRVLRLFTFVRGYAQSGGYVRLMRALVALVALILGIQILMHVLKS